MGLIPSVAEKNNIATYAITFNKAGSTNFIKGLCEDTYGKYYKNDKNTADSAAVKLVEFINLSRNHSIYLGVKNFKHFIHLNY